MARCLIIGCGCRGLELAAALISDGHAVRGTTRSPARARELEAQEVEAHVGDPDRVATLASAFGYVAVACILLGSATGSRAELEALHGSRLQMLLTKMLDTTIRGVVYETAGTVGEDVLKHGAQTVVGACESSSIPYVLLGVHPAKSDAWLGAARAAVNGLLSP